MFCYAIARTFLWLLYGVLQHKEFMLLKSDILVYEKNLG